VKKDVKVPKKVTRGWVQRVSTRFVESRRRVGTVAAIGIAILLGYHVVAGNNGLTVYQQKRAEDRQLAVEVESLKKENDRLQRHVDHLASDADAIEYEAHVRLRYARPDQVIVLNNPAPRDNAVQKQ
jgi:cell division protein FtsB